MKTNIFKFLAVAAVALGLQACHNDIIEGGETAQKGSVNLKSIGVSVNTAENVKNDSRSSIDLSDYVVTITDQAGAQVEQWAYKNMPELFSLAPGKYKVSVVSHNVTKADWEMPWYVGEKDFTVEADNVTEIGSVVCTLHNLKVTVKFTDELRVLMHEDCKVTVTANDSGVLEYTAAEGRSGYFEVVEGSNTLIAHFKGTVNGNEEDFAFPLTDIAAGQHRIITFKVKSPSPVIPDETGTINPGTGISVDSDVENEDLTGSVNIEEENGSSSDRPWGEEPGQGEDPTPDPNPDDREYITMTPCSHVQFGVKNATSDHVVVAIHADKGIAHLVVNISSTNTNFIASVEDLMPTNFDLCYLPDEYKDSLGELLLPADQIINHTDIDFNISDLVPLLNAFAGTHTFSISVTDNENHLLVKSLVFEVK